MAQRSVLTNDVPVLANKTAEFELLRVWVVRGAEDERCRRVSASARLQPAVSIGVRERAECLLDERERVATASELSDECITVVEILLMCRRCPKDPNQAAEDETTLVRSWMHRRVREIQKLVERFHVQTCVEAASV